MSDKSEIVIPSGGIGDCAEQERLNLLIFDTEIVKAIQGEDEERIPGIEYCEGWKDFDNMDISTCCAYDYRTDRYLTYLTDNISEFNELAKERTTIGFNSVKFDNNLLLANGIDVRDNHIDFLRLVWEAEGLDPSIYDSGSHSGFGLEDLCMANFGIGKSGNGALAPVQWQNQEYGSVINYCLDDNRLLKMLIDRVLENGCIIHPKRNDIIELDIESLIK